MSEDESSPTPPPDKRVQAFAALIVGFTAVQTAGLYALGFDSGALYATFTAVGLAAAALVALPQEGVRLLHGRSRWTWAAIVAALVVPLGGAAIWKITHSQTADEALLASIPQCSDEGASCEIVGAPMLATTGVGEVKVYGINRMTELTDKQHTANAGSTIAIVDSAGKLRWTRSFSPGYGLLHTATDATGNILADFAITNHLGAVWALQVTSSGVTDFGTIAGDLPAQYYDLEDAYGIRRLYVERTPWPRAGEGPTLTDVYEWRGTTYVFAGCQSLNPPRDVDGVGGVITDVVATYSAGSTECPQPVSRQSIMNQLSSTPS
ncbi:hypothetical protein [Kineococcus glutinatus]|uniref:Uncharacterized protein n=1 Tax=Kineococcus glutinatus TaxID=1070872 RepID=A0ABP9HFK0_9ACTN